MVSQLEQVMETVQKYTNENGEEEYLRKALEEAICIKRFLARYQANLFVIAESLIWEYDQWISNKTSENNIEENN